MDRFVTCDQDHSIGDCLGYQNPVEGICVDRRQLGKLVDMEQSERQVALDTH